MRHIEPLERRIQCNGGQIDTTFGVNGTASVDMTTPLGSGWRVTQRFFAQDSGGRLYVLAQAERIEAVGIKLVVARLSRDGQLDMRFNDAGFKLLDRYSASSGYEDLHLFVDQNNRAYIMNGPYIWRLTPGGRVDQSFGRKGKIVPPMLIADASSNVFPIAMAFDADGRAYIGGSATGKKGSRMAVVRITDSGAWDTTFGYQGIYKSPVSTTATTSSSSAAVQMLRFLPGGKLAVVGTYYRADIDPEYPYPEATYHPAFATHALWSTRLNPDGNVDTTYGGSGYAQHAFTDSDVEWGSESPLAISSDGSVIGVEHLVNDYEGDSAAYGSNYRFAPDGVGYDDALLIAPTSFDDLYDIEDSDRPIAVQSDGKVIARGPETSVFRSNLDGSIDMSYGKDGLANVPAQWLGDFQLAPDGSLVIIGNDDFISGETNFHRLYRDEGPAAQFDGRFIKSARSTAVRFAVTYRDDDGVNPSSIDSTDVKVTGPFDSASRTRSASLESVTPLDHGRFFAVYKITSPNGWSASDNGTYSVRLNADQVLDINGVASSPRTLGSFRVKIG